MTLSTFRVVHLPDSKFLHLHERYFEWLNSEFRPGIV